MASSTPATTLPDRAVIRLSGEDVRAFLQGLVTSDVSRTLPVWAGLLSAQGKCLFDFLVWDDGDDVLLDCEAAAADDLVKRLSMYRLRRAIIDRARRRRWRCIGRPRAGGAWPIPGWLRLGIGGWPRRTQRSGLRRSTAGWRIGLASACARGGPSLATCCGSSAMPTS